MMAAASRPRKTSCAAISRTAQFPQAKSLDTFEFNALSSLNKVLVLELARHEWI
jgi:hypothetical protein